LFTFTLVGFYFFFHVFSSFFYACKRERKRGREREGD